MLDVESKFPLHTHCLCGTTQGSWHLWSVCLWTTTSSSEEHPTRSSNLAEGNLRGELNEVDLEQGSEEAAPPDVSDKMLAQLEMEADEREISRLKEMAEMENLFNPTSHAIGVKLWAALVQSSQEESRTPTSWFPRRRRSMWSATESSLNLDACLVNELDPRHV